MADISARQQSLNRRRQLAAALQQQSMMPLEQPSMPGANMSITQPLAKIAQALFASLGNRKLDKQQEALTGELTADRTAAAQAVVPRGTGEYQVMDSPVGEAATMERLAGPQDQSNRAAMVAALAGGDPQAQEMAQTQLQNQTMDRRQNAGNAERMAQMLAGQKFDMKQLNAQQGFSAQQAAQEQASRQALQTQAQQATAAQQEITPGNYVPDGKGGFKQVGTTQHSGNLGSLSPNTVLYKGTPTDVFEDRDMESPTKGKTFLQTPQGLEDITGKTSHWDPPSKLPEPYMMVFDRASGVTVPMTRSEITVAKKDNPDRFGAANPATDAERRALGTFERVTQAEKQMSDLAPEIAKLSSAGQIQLATFPIIAQTELGKKFWTAVQPFAEAHLRRESGAQIRPDEAMSTYKTYFAWPGDTPETLKSKEVMRQKLIEGVRQGAGRAYSEKFEEPVNPRGKAEAPSTNRTRIKF